MSSNFKPDVQKALYFLPTWEFAHPSFQIAAPAKQDSLHQWQFPKVHTSL
jgi:hypothetical protein